MPSARSRPGRSRRRRRKGQPPLNPILSCPPTGLAFGEPDDRLRRASSTPGILDRSLMSLEYWVARSRLRQGFAEAAQYWLAGALAEAASRAMTSSLRIEPTSAAGPVALARLLSRRSEPQLRQSWWICPAAAARRPRQWRN